MAKILTLSEINRARRKQQKPSCLNDIKTYTSAADVRASYYQLSQWKALRQEYRSLHPLDELSLLSDKVEAAEDVHHFVSPFEYGRNEAEKVALLLNPDNLISLTKLHHGQIHGNLSALTETERRYLKERTDAVLKSFFDKY